MKRFSSNPQGTKEDVSGPKVVQHDYPLFVETLGPGCESRKCTLGTKVTKSYDRTRVLGTRCSLKTEVKKKKKNYIVMFFD